MHFSFYLSYTLIIVCSRTPRIYSIRIRNETEPNIRKLFETLSNLTNSDYRYVTPAIDDILANVRVKQDEILALEASNASGNKITHVVKGLKVLIEL